jgi:flagellar assembly protein FliH
LLEAELKMPLYNEKVIKKEHTEASVSDYKVREIRSTMTPELADFQHRQESKGQVVSFKMDPLLASMTGHAKIQDDKIKTEVEKLALEKLKEIEERAYREAYELGKKEGNEQGIKDVQLMIESKLRDLDASIEYLGSLRLNLLEKNEAKIVELCYSFAEKIAHKEIQKDPAYIIGLIKKLAVGIQEQLDTIVKISKEDHDFIESMNQTFKRTIKLGKNTKIEVDESLHRGDCIIETNYGVVDATFDARVQQLWEAVEDHLPKNAEGA